MINENVKYKKPSFFFICVFLRLSLHYKTYE